MGQKYLIDSNTIIDFCNYSLPNSAIELLLAVDPVISIISQIEIFSKKGISQTELDNLADFIDISTIHYVDKGIAEKAISVRLNHKIKLGDAIIAATALHYNLTLITRNISDFNKIKGLKLIDPYNL